MKICQRIGFLFGFVCCFGIMVFSGAWAQETPESLSQQGRYGQAVDIASKKLQPWVRACFERDEFYSRGQFEEAAASGKEALKIAEQTFGPDSPNAASSLFFLARIYRDSGKTTQAQACYQRSLEIYENKFGDNSAVLDDLLNDMVSFYRKIGNDQEAQKLAQMRKNIKGKGGADVTD